MAANRKIWVAAMVCAATVVGVTGCSKGDENKAKSDKKEPVASASASTPPPPVDPFKGLDADTIADRALTATKGATSFRMVGDGEADGEQLKLDLALDDKGACIGKMGLKDATADLLRADKVMYMKANAKFWQVTAGEGASAEEGNAMAEVLKGRWMKMSGKNAGELADVCDLKSQRKEMDKDRGKRTGMTRGADTEVDGKAAVTLTKKQSNGDTFTMYVAKEGEPFVLKTVETGSDGPGTLVLSEYNKPVKATAPPADQVMDLAKFGG
ncbi:hypothetical protein [Streptomyces purpureus]|uniref:Lipoprotein n=1 Tax=Streptomyces purpureus TaxID=1951 RepID=A0A918H561_9ACTN|nr:hypothetical protein [Streptomyces purpureus]GGT39746.1 lipoprotein [Streptomyces purpureus]